MRICSRVIRVFPARLHLRFLRLQLSVTRGLAIGTDKIDKNLKPLKVLQNMFYYI